MTTHSVNRPGLTGVRSAMTVGVILAFILAGMATVSSTERAVAAETAFYISPTGSDTSGDGSFSAPWASIAKARDHIRDNSLNDAMTADIDVFVAAGDYFVEETIEFTEEDSGSNGFDVVYRNLDAPGSARLIGGSPIQGWTPHSGEIQKAFVGIGSQFHTLYENGSRAIKARFPNHVPHPDYKMAHAQYLTSAVGTSSILNYREGDFDANGWDLSDAEVYVWSGGGISWFTDTIPIASIDTVDHRINLQYAARYPLGSGSRYYIQGSLALLDQPGEFYLDSSSGYLYYWAKDGAVGEQEIIAPTVKELVAIRGSSAASRVHSLRLDGLGFHATDFTSWYRYAWPSSNGSGQNHTYPQYDRVIAMPQHRTGMILLENTEHVSIVNSHLRNAGYSGVYMLFANRYNEVRGNLIEHVGYAGVNLEGGYPGEGDLLNNNVITNNVIHDVGELVGHGSGIYLYNSGDNEISHSVIYNSPRYAVSLKSHNSVAPQDSYLKNNRVEYLAVSALSQDSGDSGGIETWGYSASTNFFDQLLIDNVYSHPSSHDHYLPRGLFFDSESDGQTVSNVQVTGAQGLPYEANPSSTGHSFTNVSWQAGFESSLMDYSNIGVDSDFVYPVAPMRVRAGLSGSTPEVTWDGVANAASYDVLRVTQIGDNPTTVCSAVLATSCVDASAVEGTLYYYYVRSRTASGAVSPVAHPVGRTAGELRHDGFEKGFGNWTKRKGTPVLSGTQAHDGAKSYAVDSDSTIISHEFGTPQNGVVSMWFYDHATSGTQNTMARVDSASWNDSASGRWLGVYTSKSSTKYSYRVGATTYASTVPRTAGWHEFTWDYSSGARVDMYIDGVLVASPAGVGAFSQIAMGAWWGASPATVYFDNITVSDAALPPVALVSDSFEDLPGPWVVGYGTPASSADVSHSGSMSLRPDENLDVIYQKADVARGGVATVWFYDDAADTSLKTFARVDAGEWASGNGWRGIGVYPPTSVGKYSYRVGSTTHATSIARSTGWHKFTWDYRSGTHVAMYIDDTLIASPSGVVAFDLVAIGNWWDSAGGSVYYDDVAIGVTEGFETGFAAWTAVPDKGTASTSTSVAHSGAHSYALDEEVDVVAQTFAGVEQHKLVTVWMYDDASDSTLQAMATVDEGSLTSSSFRGLGVQTSVSGTKYVRRIGTAVVATDVARTTGWHELTWDYRSGTETRMYIDGILVHTVPNVSGFKRVALGDWWTGGTSGNVYFDDLSILD